MFLTRLIVRQRNYGKAKSSNYVGSDEHWLAILKYAFITRQTSELEESERKGLHVECAISGIEPKSQLTITIYSRVEDITHQLGQVELAFSPDVSDVDLFGWSCQIIDQRDKLEDQIATGGQQAHSTQQTIATLQKQLEDLVKAKEEHEHQLLSKFTLLLDEKKLKIRNQQRILQTANVNARKLEALQLTIDGEQTHKPVNKRRRDDPLDQNDEDEESDGFEAMDVDDAGNKQNSPDQDSGDDGQATETASEAEDDLDETIPAEPVVTKKAVAKPPPAGKAMSPPPPPRQLPFQKKNTSPERSDLPARKIVEEDDEETASEDDEL